MPEEIIVLEADKEYARNRIAELEQQIQGLGPEFYDVFNQSSETWHDNAPFDALRDRQSVLDAELQQLKHLLAQARPSVPKQNYTLVGIGCEVLINGKTYFIAGDWTPFAGQTKNNVMIISAQAPLAKQLLGHVVGATFMLAGHVRTIEQITYPKV